MQAFGERGVKNIAALHKRLETVGIENFRPEIAVIAGAIALAGEDVLKMRCPVAHGDSGRHPDDGEASGFKGDDINVAGLADEMQIKIEQRRGRKFNGGETLIEAARRQQLLHQAFGHGLAIGAASELAQNFWLLEPMFVKLRREFDEVARDIRAGQGGIDDVGQETMQSVAKFVKQSARLINAEQAGFAGRGLGEIHHIDDDGLDRAIELLLVAERTHPSAAAL